ncbi:conserved Plasmodium protein, unknown function [Plasmodium berghei]|uniref:Uncharacterized protein n=2 Tax=Plasmodium berghei TaxID=5821 RepID=A0A509AIE5_PLABA|nr:conserved Plasmodium protein, unknown function [Plasmodium berghei ANKA]CXI32609.1 conserved Plasmodium protein, unknown function [Plasmodium berghei]SCM21155.1 conserved Plasmodium protein, unknown function [Plasmodium berghei]SCN24493.1 conserved Plasmodium protein, unknown function [Plasmodium berghei]SCO59675.1 conserved Plasmodium protein, unknown function [Plasmodium berghei]SCO60865.1 conserved Plasmodium protein, unknown function [Plasmodium berghei]|eukprot:XP_034421146.1 conserved Plasmodium protein, unknown function [Plasmodium berghei ANKA]
MTKLKNGIFCLPDKKWYKNVEVKNSKTAKKYIYKCIDIRKIEKQYKSKKLENYYTYINLYEQILLKYCYKNEGNETTNKSDLNFSSKENNNDGIHIEQKNIKKKIRPLFDGYSVTSIYVFESLIFLALSGGIINIFDKNFNLILQRKLDNFNIKNISANKKENTICFVGSSDDIHILYLDEISNPKEENDIHVWDKKIKNNINDISIVDVEYIANTTISKFGTEFDNTVIQFNKQLYQNLNKNEKIFVDGFVHNNIVRYNINRLNNCVINPHFDNYENNNLCILSSNTTVSVLYVYGFYINNTVLFKDKNIYNIYWYNSYIFICKHDSVYIINFFCKTKIVHMILSYSSYSFESIRTIPSFYEKEKVDEIKIGKIEKERFNYPIFICEAEKEIYVIGREKNIKVLKLGKKNQAEEVKVIYDFFLTNYIINMYIFYNKNMSMLLGDQKYYISIITRINQNLTKSKNKKKWNNTSFGHIILTSNNYIVYKNNINIKSGDSKCVYMIKNKMNDNREKYICSKIHGNTKLIEESKQINDEKCVDHHHNKLKYIEEHSFIDTASINDITVNNCGTFSIFQYCKYSNCHKRKDKKKGVNNEGNFCLYIYHNNNAISNNFDLYENNSNSKNEMCNFLMGFREKNIMEIFTYLLEEKRKNIFTILNKLKKEEIKRSNNELTNFIVQIIYLCLKYGKCYLAAKIFIKLNEYFYNKQKVTYDIIVLFFFFNKLHILSKFYTKLKRHEREKVKKKKYIYKYIYLCKTENNYTIIQLPNILGNRCRRNNYKKKKKIKSIVYVIYHAMRIIKKNKLKRKNEKDKRKKKKKNIYYFFNTKNIFNKFLILLLLNDVYEFNKIYKCSPSHYLNIFKLSKYIISYLRNNIGYLKKNILNRFNLFDLTSLLSRYNIKTEEEKNNKVKNTKIKNNDTIHSTSYNNNFYDKNKKNSKLGQYYNYKSKSQNFNSENFSLVSWKKKKKFEKKILLDILLNILFKCNYSYPIELLLCRTQEKKKKNICKVNDKHTFINHNFSNINCGYEIEKDTSKHLCQKNQGNEHNSTRKYMHKISKDRITKKKKNNIITNSNSNIISNDFPLSRDTFITCTEEIPYLYDKSEHNDKNNKNKNNSSIFINMNYTKFREKYYKGENVGKKRKPQIVKINEIDKTRIHTEYTKYDECNKKKKLNKYNDIKKEKIINMLIEKKDETVFYYLNQCNCQCLKKIINKNANKLCQINIKKTIPLLLIKNIKGKGTENCEYFFNPNIIIKKLKKNPYFLYRYLKKLQNVEYLRIYIDLFIFLIFIFDPLLLIKFLNKYYKYINFKRVHFFASFFNYFYLTIEKEKINLNCDNNTNYSDKPSKSDSFQIYTEKINIKDDSENFHKLSIEENNVNEPFKWENKEDTISEFKDIYQANKIGERLNSWKIKEEWMKRKNKKKLKKCFKNENISLLYNYLLNNNVEKNKLVDLFNFIKKESKKNKKCPKKINLFMHVEGYIYIKLGYINKAIDIYRKLCNYEEVYYLIKHYNISVQENIKKEVEKFLLLNSYNSIENKINNDYINGNIKRIYNSQKELNNFNENTNNCTRDITIFNSKKNGDNIFHEEEIKRNKKRGIIKNEKIIKLKKKKLKSIKNKTNVIEYYISNSIDCDNMDKEIMHDLYSEDIKKKKKKKCKNNQIDILWNNDKKKMKKIRGQILKHFLLDHMCKEMNYSTLVNILQDLYYKNEILVSYNSILSNDKINIFNMFNEVKKKGYIIYNGKIRKEIKKNELKLININEDYLFSNNDYENKQKNMIFNESILQSLNKNNTLDIHNERTYNTQQNIPPNYYFYDEIRKKTNVSELSSFCVACLNNIYHDAGLFSKKKKKNMDLKSSHKIKNNIVFFFCNHIYHLRCLKDNEFVCEICS